MHEWPVFFFTLLLQAAIGVSAVCFIHSIVLHNSLSHEDILSLLRYQLLIIPFLAVSGLAASFAHLGYPWNAPHAIRHMSTSWMSREIILTGCFVGLSLLIVFMAFYFMTLSFLLLGLLALIGIAALFCMGELYRATTVITWIPRYTHATFFGATAIFGGVLSFILLPNWELSTKMEHTDITEITSITLCLVYLGLAVQIVLLPYYVQTISFHSTDHVVTYPHKPVTVYKSLLTLQIIRWGLAIAGIVFLTVALWVIPHIIPKVPIIMTLIAALLLITSESLGRYIYFRIG